MGDATSIEERLHGIFAGWRQRARERRPQQETPRETERRAMEQLYGEPHRAVVRTEERPGGGS